MGRTKVQFLFVGTKSCDPLGLGLDNHFFLSIANSSLLTIHAHNLLLDLTDHLINPAFPLIGVYLFEVSGM